MLKRGQRYRDNATDYEALSVKKNAPPLKMIAFNGLDVVHPTVFLQRQK